MWWVLILKKIRIMPFFFWGGGCGEGGGGLLHHKIYLNLLHLNINKHFLYTVLYTFPKVKENLLNNPNLL